MIGFSLAFPDKNLARINFNGILTKLLSGKAVGVRNDDDEMKIIYLLSSYVASLINQI